VNSPDGKGIDPNNFHLLIYDRWGEKVFETTDLEQGWDGRIKGGKIGENAVYSWLVIYKNTQGVEQQEVGIVTLIR
jgi:gliding motility-associated-like protein